MIACPICERGTTSAALQEAAWLGRRVDCRPGARRARFTLHDHDARSVAVRGSWSNWIDEARAERIARGAWEASLPLLEAGRYHYKFLLDDSAWLPDPGNPFRSVDDDGNVNSVLVVG